MTVSIVSTVAISDPSVDHLVIYHGRSWAQFKFIQKGFEDAPGVRLFYYDGTVEILMPGLKHEIFGRAIGVLLAFFFHHKGIFFQPTGAVTQEKEGKASAQADESYCIGSVKTTPDLSIEVVFTSGGINKLARCEALGVPEVWFWEDGTLAMYHLRSQGYEIIDRSQLAGLADLDLDRFKRCILMAETDLNEAINTLMQSLD